MGSKIKVFKARKIRTMNSNRPVATYVAVKDGKILGVGDIGELSGWGELEIDDRFADKVLMPGFVEAHAHAFTGSVWRDVYLGYFERVSPEGVVVGGYKNIDEVVEALKEAEGKMTDPDAPLLGWGFDPIYFDGGRMTVEHLDPITATRPILIMHANGHLMNVNRVVLEKAGVTRDTNVEGVAKGADGEPTGELQEMAAMYLARKVVPEARQLGVVDDQGVRLYAKSAMIAGVTTASDLANSMPDEHCEALQALTAQDDFPLRLKPALYAIAFGLEEGLERARGLKRYGNDKFYTDLVKVMTDGSIQGFSARLKWPGYYNGAENGLWNLPPEQLKAIIKGYHAEGCHIHIHVNGDQASEFAIDCFEAALAENPRADHRHTLQHCQMADASQFRRMAKLGLCANLFANHLYYWGDQHYAYTMGPDRANRMDACRTALDNGVALGIHCDSPITPIAPLFTAWCAVNRITATGRLLGAEECITPEEAFYAITIGAAYQLKMDHLIGSIEVGKFADFAVLEDDPFEVDPMAIKDVPVWGTVVGGIAFESPMRNG